MKARGKPALADVICYCKMTSEVALDGVTWLLRLIEVINISKCMRLIQTIGGNYSVQWRELFSAMAESWKELKTSNVFSLFIVC